MSDVDNLIKSFKPNKGRWDFEPGDICLYREGIVLGKVEVLSKTLTERKGTYRLKCIERISRFPLPEEFECGTVFGYEGNSGWSLKLFTENSDEA